MFAVTYQLRLLQPVLVAMLDPGDENARRSLNYVPGSVMRGVLANRYIIKRSLSTDNAIEDRWCHTLFFSGAVRFLNCTLAGEYGTRTLPTPLSWFAGKTELAEWNSNDRDSDLPIADGVDESTLALLTDAKPIHAEASFCQLSTGDEGVDSAQLYLPARDSQTHIFRPHKRKDIDAKKERGVFTYESLAAGQLFCGVVLTETHEQAQEIRALLDQQRDLRIGRSRSAGYGHAEIEGVSDPIADWQEVSTLHDLTPLELEDEEGRTNRVFIVTLLSDVVLRDALGQFSNDIANALGVTPDNNTNTTCYRQVIALGGFNRKWRLPTVQVAALRAGSSFVFPANRIDVDRLRAALANGIGERLNDGFGRIAVNWQTGRSVVARMAQSKRPSPLPARKDDEPQKNAIATLILASVTRRKLERELVRISEKYVIRRPPSNAMLSRVRMAARQSALAGSLAPLERFMSDVAGDEKSRKPALAAMKQARIGDKPLNEWLQERIAERDVESQLQLAALSSPEMKLGSASISLSALPDDLKTEFTARLIERVVKRAIKNNQKDGGR